MQHLDRAVREWTPQTLRDAYLAHGCAIVRGAVDPAMLDRLREAIDRAYLKTSDVHVYDAAIREADGELTGFEVADTSLLRGFLDLLYAGQAYKGANVAARRVHGSSEVANNFQVPLKLHVDAQYHGPTFTVNFWTPLQACGVDSPTILLVPVDYKRTRAHVGFTGKKLREGGEFYTDFFDLGSMDVDVVKRTFGDDIFLCPVMAVGDVVIASNWIIHGSHHTATMTQGRKSVEVRFIGTRMDVRGDGWLTKLIRLFSPRSSAADNRQARPIRS